MSVCLYPRLPETILPPPVRDSRREREKKEPVLKFSDARISRGSFAREKERALIVVADVDDDDGDFEVSGIKYWFLTQLESSSFHGSFPRSSYEQRARERLVSSTTAEFRV